MRRYWLFLGLACLGLAIFRAVTADPSPPRPTAVATRAPEPGRTLWNSIKPSPSATPATHTPDRRLLGRIHGTGREVAVAFDAGVAVAILSSYFDDENDRTTGSFSLRLFSVRTGKALSDPVDLYTRKSPKHQHPAVPEGPYLTPDYRYALIGCYFPREELRIFDIKECRLLDTTIPIRGMGSNGWSSSPDGLVSYQTRSGFVIVDPGKATVVRSYKSPQQGLRVHGVTFEPSGRWVLMATTHGVLVASARGDDAPRTLFPRSATKLTVTKGGQALFLHEGKVMQLDIASGRLVGDPIGSGYLDLQATPDGTLALASRYDESEVLELPSGKLRCHRKPAGWGLLSPAGDVVLAAENASTGQATLIWETKPEQKTVTLADSLMEPVSISPDGKIGATCDGSNISLWRL